MGFMFGTFPTKVLHAITFSHLHITTFSDANIYY